MLSKHHIVNWLLDCEHIFTEQRDYLTALDTDIGDGDHGLNMQRGFAKVAEKLPAVADKDIGQVLKTTGMTLLSSVGGASGPLYGTFFIRAAASSDACQSLTLGQLGKMLSDGVEGIVSRGRADALTVAGDLAMLVMIFAVANTIGADRFAAIRAL